ncbi:MAG: FAD-dependent oxidoreductase [Pyrinomonadaceae bacterium]|nr:FAD-dependent oxidoreductase [Chloracidobacterium sp.]MBP7415412.1 FAD-dependent oxidoreductase [Pyrinomonadaceae bacterium]
MNSYDVIIIGGGPGGLSAAFWCAEMGLKAIILEQEVVTGGQLLRTYGEIKNYLGVGSASGTELSDMFLHQVETKDVVMRTGVEIETAYLVERKVVLVGGEEIRGESVIIATGVRRRKLNISGEDEFFGKGILESGVRDQNEVAGKRVVIVGGGDAALENALILGAKGERVFVVHRRAEFTAREEFIEKAKSNEKVEFVFNSQLTAIVGNEHVDGVDVRDNTTGATLHIPVDAVLVRVGVEPNTELFRGQIATDKAGYICINADCSTDLVDIFAVGDAANPLSPTINSAAGQGATAAKIIAHNFIR